MPDQDTELVAVKLDEGWFLTLHSGDPTHGLVISEECARLLGSAHALLVACRTAYRVIRDRGGSSEETELLAESALVQLDTVIKLADGHL